MPKKRQRTNIPMLATVMIDSYLPLYTSLKGDARKALVTSIKEAMDIADPTWALSWLVIDTRLDNQLKLTNAAAAASAAAVEAEAAAAGEPVN